MKICILGQGYIGIPVAALFAENNCEVIGVDVDKNKVEQLNLGILPIEEDGIETIMQKSLELKKYKASLTPEVSDVYIITVPTPYIKDTFECDLSFVISACYSILNILKKNDIVIIESTIAPLSMDDIIKPIFEEKGFQIGKDLFLAHCPERVLPGNILHELIYNDRIIGGITENCTSKASEVYSIFVKGNLIRTEAKTAEFSKCMENTFRDVNIALANELVQICNDIGVNALNVIELANRHPRVNIHQPGPGVGGHCLAIDPYFIYNKSPKNANIIKLARDTNNYMPKFVSKSTKKIAENNNIKKISIFGLAYKGNTDDDRESPSYDIINYLKDDFEISIYDPHVRKNSYNKFEESINNSDLILILTNHDEFKELNYDYISKHMNQKIIFDTKNIIKNVPEDITLINYGNLSNFLMGDI